MSRVTDPTSEQLRRIPGLFRKWELPDLFEAQRHYQIEEAGEHADGTPLFALFVGSLAPGAEESEGFPDAETTSDPHRASHRSRGIRLSVQIGEPEVAS